MVFALLCGDLPFEDTQENYAVGNFEPLYQIILMGEFEFSQECWNRIDPSAQVMLEVCSAAAWCTQGYKLPQCVHDLQYHTCRQCSLWIHTNESRSKMCFAMTGSG